MLTPDQIKAWKDYFNALKAYEKEAKLWVKEHSMPGSQDIGSNPPPPPPPPPGH